MFRQGSPFGFSGGPFGFAPSGFTGVLDRLSVRPYAAWSSSRRLTRRWTGPIVTGFRSTDGEQRDFYGRGRLGLIDTTETRAFCGWNRLQWSSDLRSTAEAGSSRLWGNSITGTGVAPTATLVAGGGPGGYNATRLQFDLGGGTTTGDISRRVQNVVTPVGLPHVLSFRIRSYDGASTYRMHAVSPTGATVNFDATPDWTTVEVPATAISSSISFGLGLRGGQTPANSNTADVLISEVQVELASARSTYDHREGTAAAHVIRRKEWEQMGTGLHNEQTNSTLMEYLCYYGVPVTENGIQSALHVASEFRRSAVPASTALFKFLHITGGAVYLVHRTNDTPNAKSIISNFPSAITNRGISLYRVSTEALVVAVGNGTASVVAVTKGGSISTSNVLTITDLDPGNATLAFREATRQNGVLLTGDNSLSAAPDSGDAAGNLTSGAWSGGAAPHDGTISERMIWQASPPPADREILAADAIELWSFA